MNDIGLRAPLRPRLLLSRQPSAVLKPGSNVLSIRCGDQVENLTCPEVWTKGLVGVGNLAPRAATLRDMV